MAAANGAQSQAQSQGQSKADSKEEDPVLARVDKYEIRLSDVYKQIESLSLGDQIDVRDQIGRFTDSMVTEEILFQAVLAGRLATEEDLRSKIKNQVVEYVIDKHVRSKIDVTDEDIRRYYAENRDLVRGLHVRVRQIQLKERAQCEQVQKRIGSDEDFAREAAANSLDRQSAEQGGDMGYLMPVLRPQSLGFEMEFFKMGLGEMRVFDSPGGCHLVRVTEILDPPDPPFEQMRAYVLPILERQQEQALLRQLIESASRDISVQRLNSSSQ